MTVDLELMAKQLHEQLERMCFSEFGEWQDVNDGHREAVREIVEHLLQSWTPLLRTDLGPNGITLVMPSALNEKHLFLVDDSDFEDLDDEDCDDDDLDDSDFEDLDDADFLDCDDPDFEECATIIITEGMVCAAAEVLLEDSFLDLSRGRAEDLARQMLERALRNSAKTAEFST